MNPRDVLSYIHNRCIVPSDRVVIKHPGYSKGHYHDADHKMLYILFQMLVDFVEIELAARNGNTCFETIPQTLHRKITDLPIMGWLIPPIRNAQQGLHHLRWAMKLTDMPSQSQHARDVFALYKFWVHTRPRRVDAWDWADTFVEPKRIKTENGCLSFSTEYEAMLDKSAKLEDKYDKEDQKMLQLLIKNRRGLWT